MEGRNNNKPLFDPEDPFLVLQQQRTAQFIRVLLKNLQVQYQLSPTPELEERILRTEFALNMATNNLN